MATENRPLLSRVADSLYWMARYMERAENMARLIEVNIYLQLDLPLDSNQWRPLIDTCGDAEIFLKDHGESTQENVIAFLAHDREYSNSIISCVRSARENARAVRETISSEVWEHINSVYHRVQAQDPAAELSADTFRDIRLAGHMFQGITDATMSHNEAWQFVRLGRQMERADKTSRLLDVKYFMLLPSAASVGTPYDDLQWSAVLKSVSGFQMYRQSRGRISPREVANFLVLDPDFPRSIRHSVRGAADALRIIIGPAEDASQYPSMRLLKDLSAELEGQTVDRIIQTGLHEYLDGLQVKMNDIGAALRNDFFAAKAMDRKKAKAGSQSQTQTQTQTVMSAGGN